MPFAKEMIHMQIHTDTAYLSEILTIRFAKNDIEMTCCHCDSLLHQKWGPGLWVLRWTWLSWFYHNASNKHRHVWSLTVTHHLSTHFAEARKYFGTIGLLIDLSVFSSRGSRCWTLSKLEVEGWKPNSKKKQKHWRCFGYPPVNWHNLT